MAIGICGGEFAADVDRFLRGGRGIGVTAQFEEPDAQASQGVGEFGAVTVGIRGGQFAADRDALLAARGAPRRGGPVRRTLRRGCESEPARSGR